MSKVAVPTILAAALLASVSVPTLAADLYEPPMVEVQREIVEVSTGGWYLRGDLDFAFMQIRGVDYHAGGNLNSFITSEVDNTWSIGAGIGYQINNYLRADLTADYEFSSDFRGSTSGDCSAASNQPGSCTSADSSSYSMLILMANAYVDLGKYHGFTPYVGAGIGGAYVSWDTLNNTATCTATVCNGSFPGGPGTTITASPHAGVASWRFAWSLSAGASYDLTSNLKLDAGYRYTRVHGGAMFDYVPTGCCTGLGTQGYDNGFNIHQVRAGLRYQFGGGEVIREIDPEPQVVYK